MIKKIKQILKVIINNFEEFFYIEKKQHYRNFYIKLPSFHLLPLYQRLHLRYDQFLPNLVNQMTVDNTVIDVGANCGDTLAGMVESNASLQYICIEPNELFYNLLNSNIELIKSKHQNLEVITVRGLVGKEITSASLSGSGGTKSADLDRGLIHSRTLDDIVAGIKTRKIGLLKSDVDGFDYDVLNSASDIVSKSKPIIFFECEYSFEYQRTGFVKTIEWLHSLDYQDWVIFDNFGEVVLRTKNIDQVIQLMNYVWRQNKNLTTRTIYYFDILVSSEKDLSLIDSALLSYLDAPFK